MMKPAKAGQTDDYDTTLGQSDRCTAVHSVVQGSRAVCGRLQFTGARQHSIGVCNGRSSQMRSCSLRWPGKRQLVSVS